MDTSAPVTDLLQRAGEGDADAFNALMPVVYDELRRLAHSRLRQQSSSDTLNTTALVHEAYLKLIRNPSDIDWQNRRHFFAIAARAMRQVLVSYAVMKRAAKRGAGVQNISLDDAPFVMSEQRADELLALDEALKLLLETNERQGRIVECRYFAGLTLEETAQVLGVSVPTVTRDWRVAKAWLYRVLRGG
ncbi:MAG: ECF-type sigma factor [Bacteroidota bacterium]